MIEYYIKLDDLDEGKIIIILLKIIKENVNIYLSKNNYKN